MSNKWLRLWHDMPNDPKWRTISRISKQPIALVQALYMHLLVDASQGVTRGHISITTEDLASALDVSEEDIESVLNAMQGRVLSGDELTGWDKRQPIREDSGNERTGAKSAAQRKREQRERERLAAKNANVTDVTDVTKNVTCHENKENSHETVTNECDIKTDISDKNSSQPIDSSALSRMSRNVTTDKDKDKDKDKNINKKINKKNPDAQIEEAFGIFWESGMLKVGKQTALKAFKTKAKESGLDVKDFATKLAVDVGKRLKAKQFGFGSLHPSTYLNQSRWEDEIVENKSDVPLTACGLPKTFDHIDYTAGTYLREDGTRGF